MTTFPTLTARAHLFNDRTARHTRLLAFVDLTIADAFVIKGIRVLQRVDQSNTPEAERPFVVFPADKGGEGDSRGGKHSDRWFDVAHPVTAEARAAALRVVLHAYAEAVAVAAQA